MQLLSATGGYKLKLRPTVEALQVKPTLGLGLPKAEIAIRKPTSVNGFVYHRTKLFILTSCSSCGIRESSLQEITPQYSSGMVGWARTKNVHIVGHGKHLLSTTPNGPPRTVRIPICSPIEPDLVGNIQTGKLPWVLVLKPGIRRLQLRSVLGLLTRHRTSVSTHPINGTHSMQTNQAAAPLERINTP